MKSFLILIIIFVSYMAVAMDKPGGIARTAESQPVGTYEVLLSPAITLNYAGAYLASELRYQPNDDVGVGLGFGAGQAGFHVGGQGVWYIAPDLETQPAFALVGGAYFSRFDQSDYFLVKFTPMVSKQINTSWALVTPYAGVTLSPIFRMASSQTLVGMKLSAGAETRLHNWKGIRLWAEMGVGVLNAVSEIVFGLSYPVSLMGG